MSSSLNNAHECLLSPVVFSSLSLLWRMSSSWNNACECLLSLVVFSSLSLTWRMSSSPKQCMWVFVESCGVLHFIAPSENVIIIETMPVLFMGSCSVLHFIAPAWNAIITETMPVNICRVLKCFPWVCPVLLAVAWVDQLTSNMMCWTDVLVTWLTASG